MTPATEKIQPPPPKNKLAERWNLIIFLLVLPLLTVTATATASVTATATASVTATATASVTRTATATATTTSTASVTATPTATATTTPTPTITATPTPTTTATSTSKPVATKTTAPSSTPETTVKVSGDFANLRTGPGTNFANVRVLTLGEPLMLLGRLSDNTWLYVKTSDGQEGWIKTTSVDLAGINVDYDYYPVKTPSPSPETMVKVSGDFVNLRTGPGANFSKVRVLTFGELLMLLGRFSDNTWLYVKTLDGQEGWIITTSVNLAWINFDYDYYPVKTSPPTETSTPVVLVGIEGRWIDIDLSDQMLYAYDGTVLVASFLVSTGLDLYPTERGQYRIYVKMRYSDMRGDDYFLPDVPYTMYYSGDFSIHGTYWHHNFGTPMSRGCINMDTSDAEWLYNWSSVGTLVNIHR